LDAQGNIVPTASNTVTFAVSSGNILGVGNGNPSSHEADKASQRAVFNGLAQVIIQSANQPSSIILTATSAGLTSTNVTVIEAAKLPAPVPPTGVAVFAGNAQAAVSWDVVPGAITYNVYRSTTSGGPYTNIVTNLGGLGYTDGSVSNFTTYYYVVSANGNGTGANSAEVSATPTAIVSGVTAVTTNNRISINWIGSPGAAYNLKRSFVTGGPYTTIAASTTSTNFTDSNVVSCQLYYYVVTITNAGNESLNSPEASAEVPSVLPPQFTSADVGAVGLPGSASFCSGQFTVSGSGSDIWNTNDAFQFVYTYVPVSTNCDIRAYVGSVQNTSGNAKAGVMIRETLDPGSRHALVDMEWSAGIEFLFRTNTAGSSYSVSVSGQAAPNWVRLTRTNNLFRAYWSADGNTWNQIGVATNISMSGTSAYIGLAVCAHNNIALNTSTLDSVSASFLTNAPPVISWVFPTNNATFIQPNAITLTASAGDADGTVTNVAFFNGATLLTNVTSGAANQYSLIWNNVPLANYTLTAVATDNLGATNTSPAVIGISVVPIPPANLRVVSGPQVNGQFSLNFQGYTNQNYVLQASTNMVSWLSIQTNLPTGNGLVLFTDSNATGLDRFYRVKAGP